jgi:hypothetical protein
MDGVGGVPGSAVRFLGPHAAGEIIVRGGFRPNGTSNPTIFRGPLASGRSSNSTFTSAAFSVVYGATGIYTVSLTATGWKFPANDPPAIFCDSQCKDVTNTNRFYVYCSGFTAATRSFVISAFQEATPFAPPSDAGNWIDFVIFGGTKF